MSKNQFNILIAEGIPSLNKGELAILLGMLKSFQPLGKTDISLFSFIPSCDEERYPRELRLIDVMKDLHLGTLSFHHSICNTLKMILLPLIQHILFIFLHILLGKNVLKLLSQRIWRAYHEADVILICHDQVSCVGGFLLGFSPVYIALLAKVLRKPLVIYGNGTPSIHGWLWCRLARFVLNSAALVTVREADSFEKLRKLAGSKAQVYLTGDPAVLAMPSDPSTVKRILMDECIPAPDSFLVGVALSKSVLEKCRSSDSIHVSSYRYAIRELAKVFDNIIERFNATIVFLPHCIEPYEERDDRIVAHSIYDELRNKPNTRLLTKEYSLQDLKGMQGIFDIFVGSRIHSVIGALTMNVPSCTLAASSDVRATGLIGKLFQQERWIYQVENLTANALLQHLYQLIECAQTIREELIPIVRSAKLKGMKNGILLREVLLRDSNNQI